MSELVDVGRGHSLSPEAAASWKRMVAARMPDDGLTSSTRSLARQWELYNHKGQPGWPKYVAHPNESKHVWRPDDKKDKGGRAVDVSGTTRTWMIRNAAEHGWYRPWPDIEPWHFEYVIKDDKHKDDDVALTNEDIQKIAEAVSKHQNTLSANAAKAAGTKTLSVAGALQQNIYTRRDVREILARLNAVEKALNKGTGVSAKDVAKELRPLIVADIKTAIAGIPAADADRIADAVVEAFGLALAGD